MKRMVFLLTVITVIVGSAVFPATRNSLEVGVFSLEDEAIQPIKIWVDANDRIMLVIEGDAFYMLPEHSSFVISVLGEAIKLIEVKTYSLKLNTEPVILYYAIDNTKHKIKITASTGIREVGQIIISFDDFEIVLEIDDSRRLIDILEKTKKVSEEIRRQRESFQFSENVYNEMKNINDESRDQVLELR